VIEFDPLGKRVERRASLFCYPFLRNLSTPFPPSPFIPPSENRPRPPPLLTRRPPRPLGDPLVPERHPRGRVSVKRRGRTRARGGRSCCSTRSNRQQLAKEAASERRRQRLFSVLLSLCRGPLLAQQPTPFVASRRPLIGPVLGSSKRRSLACEKQEAQLSKKKNGGARTALLLLSRSSSAFVPLDPLLISPLVSLSLLSLSLLSLSLSLFSLSFLRFQ